MRRHLMEMTLPELQIEHKKMIQAIERLGDTRNETGLFQLHSARALKFAIECVIRNRGPAPVTDGSNVVSLSEYRTKRTA